MRSQFFVEHAGEAVFRMRDAQGQIRMKLGASGHSSGFILMDDQTETVVQTLASVSALTNIRDTGVTVRNGAATLTLTPRKSEAAGQSSIFGIDFRLCGGSLPPWHPDQVESGWRVGAAAVWRSMR